MTRRWGNSRKRMELSPVQSTLCESRSRKRMRTTVKRGRCLENICLIHWEAHMKDSMFTRVLYSPLISPGQHSCSHWMPHWHGELILLPVPTVYPDILSKLEPDSMLNSEGFALTVYKLLGEYSDQVNETLILSICPQISFQFDKALHRS